MSNTSEAEVLHLTLPPLNMVLEGNILLNTPSSSNKE
jgi:hypothetical protein